MLLFLSRPEDIHTDWIEAECERRGINYFRFCTESFPIDTHVAVRLKNGRVSGCIETETDTFDLSKVRGVWYRRPGAPTLSPQVSAEYTLQGLSESRETLTGLYRSLSDRNWVNPPYNVQAYRGKIFQYRLAHKLGFSIPRTLITNKPDDVLAFFESCNQQMIYKPMGLMNYVDENEAEYGVYTTVITEETLHANLATIQLTPCLFQGLVKKAYELRVNVIGDNIFATAIHSQQSDETQVDYRVDTDNCAHSRAILPAAIEEKCLKMMRLMGLRMGNFDFIVTPEGEYIFLEVNVNGQWAWVEHKVGWPLCKTLVDELSSINQ